MLRGTKGGKGSHLPTWTGPSRVKKKSTYAGKSVDEVQKMTFIDMVVVHFLLCSPL